MKNIVIGVGNLLFKDEGVGILAAKYLEENYKFEGDIEIIDGGTLGFKLMTYFQEYDNVIILDTVSIEDKVGDIYRLPSDVLLGLGQYRKTAHEVEIVEMLEICSVLDKHAEVTIIGIIPEDIISVQIGLTKTIEDKFMGLINQAITDIENLGIKVEKNDEQKSIAQICKGLLGSYNDEYDERIPNDEDTTR
ncbi:hydrogenase maturation protease [Arcobacter nitrofigilis DSM 7299]|uniref:Hydrogenase maturation protease n=1 Tax=Arcobacter nitrofigilis (strain ATCC 33309 / DSM 7299 / CCUG 15893 / LMG 7604 / NCTC 12251 / CI) TaxID=572480 RepID=D5V586_ARCNC|nr:HyaD/HybD family hydrogenase maturation endopeptidase [Arcobacter nitrofigilis]ADG93021.1 hydrogenase maturation protease [Arcobacter nitrofigilis DSM 7299]